MTAIYNLRARNNCTFRLTLDFSTLAAAGADLTKPIKMQIKRSPFDASAAYTWETGATSGGAITIDPVSHLGVLTAPEADMAALSGGYVYDVILEQTAGVIPAFSGRLTFAAGITAPDAGMSAFGATGIADTVTIDGVRCGTVAVVPVSLTAILAACQALTDPATLVAAIIANPTALAALAAALGGSITPPSGASTGFSFDFSTGLAPFSIN